VLERFFTRTPLAGSWELNDFGATPGVVNLRLRQAREAAAAAAS
jgi:malonate decarboxylase delta subunit